MRDASAVLIAMGLLLGVAFMSLASLSQNGMRQDVASNLHQRFQSLLIAWSIGEMARLCLETHGVESCAGDFFEFDVYQGGYDYREKDGEERIVIYVEGKNVRTSATLRSRLEIPLKTKEKNAGRI